MEKSGRADVLLRFIKGMFIGSGFILPGVSGGALAAVFGIYERLIAFLANITKKFKENILYFLPVGLGAALGIFLLSFVVSFLLDSAKTYVLWFFIGCIVGTLPSLFRQANKKGHKPVHIGIMAVTTIAAFAFLKIVDSNVAVAMAPSFFVWILAGVLIGLGVIVPGLSPSNFLVYLDLYKPMADGIKGLDFGVIIPLILGVVLCVLTLSKLMNYLFGKAYTGIYYFILGVVFASTLVIVPLDFNYLSWGTLLCLAACAAGAVLALFMSRLEDKYRPEEEPGAGA